MYKSVQNQQLGHQDFFFVFFMIENKIYRIEVYKKAFNLKWKEASLLSTLSNVPSTAKKYFGAKLS